MSGKKSFEDSLRELEEIVTELEEGGVDLGESLKKFEAGVKLYKNCKKNLNDAEKKVKILLDDLKEESL